MKRIAWVPLASIATVFVTQLAHASFPVAVWVKAQNVVLEPDATSPTRVRMEGAAMLYDGNTKEIYLGYTAPALGYLYYECPSGQATTCVEEWKDILANVQAPSTTCVGFGSQQTKPGTLREIGVTPTKPDVYPIAM